MRRYLDLKSLFHAEYCTSKAYQVSDYSLSRGYLFGLCDFDRYFPMQTIAMLEDDQISCFACAGDFIISVAIRLVEAFNLKATFFTA